MPKKRIWLCFVYTISFARPESAPRAAKRAYFAGCGMYWKRPSSDNADVGRDHEADLGREVAEAGPGAAGLEAAVAGCGNRGRGEPFTASSPLPLA